MTVPTFGGENDGELLERAAPLGALHGALGEARAGRGRLLLLAGEAGAGKTALLRRFAADVAGSARVLWGACDPLFTPRPLGPFLDIAEQATGEFRGLVSQGVKPHETLAALLRELDRGRPSLLVLEDVHWADEASLDLLGMIGRRIGQAAALVVASYRDDELGRADALRTVVGELATAPAVTRLGLGLLSPAAVAAMARPYGVDELQLYRQTGGNPFFVTEVLASGAAIMPPTVRDAVLARASRAGPGARQLLEAIAVVPAPVETWLLEALAAGDVSHLDECLASGMLIHERGRVGFRHELARLAIEDSIPAGRAMMLHRAALRALGASPGARTDPAGLAHHAERANDAGAVLTFATAAGDQAAAVGAHREAAAQYGRALRFAESLPPELRASLLERRSYECYLSDQPEHAIEARRQALAAYQRLGDRRAEGESLCWLSRLLFFASRNVEAEETGRRAIAILEGLPPGRELAMAYSSVSHVRMLADDAPEAIRWGKRAITLAERLDETEVLVHALNNVGSAMFRAGSQEGRAKLERSLALASEAALNEHIARAYVNLASIAVDLRLYETADRYLADGIGFATEQGVDAWRWYLVAVRARGELERGRWHTAVASARTVLAAARPTSFARLTALVVLARVRARRGEPGCWPLLDEALGIATLNCHLQQVGPVAAARAEAAWLEGSRAEVDALTREWLDLARLRGDAWIYGELAYWRWKAGITGAARAAMAEPYALHVGGEWAAASECWSRLGCPYEAAVALADSHDAEALRRALSALTELGAKPAAAAVARRLRSLGERGVPRGPRAATRANPAGLTGRQLEVACLVVQGLPNNEIAARLVLSPKTVEHHVSAILRKLGVRSRLEMSAAAAGHGLTPEA